jgi:hypothetical protein
MNWQCTLFFSNKKSSLRIILLQQFFSSKSLFYISMKDIIGYNSLPFCDLVIVIGYNMTTDRDSRLG